VSSASVSLPLLILVGYGLRGIDLGCIGMSVRGRSAQSSR
jgi:hypothetical protein